MLKDARARRAWRLYFLKAEAVLSPLSATVRRELLSDLKDHVRDILANETGEGGELARVRAALERVGNPREFLAPLLADAVFRAPPRIMSVGATYEALTLYASRGWRYLTGGVALVFTVFASGAIALAAFNSLLRPDHAGIFLLPNEEIQIRVMGFSSSSGEQILAPWMALIVIVLGLVLLAWTTACMRRMLMELIASTV
jgi:hypothetical protein